MSFFGKKKTKKIKKDLLNSEQKKNKSDADPEGLRQPDYKSPRPKGITRFWKVRYYQKFFDVTTTQIMRRVLIAVFPWARTPIFDTGKPDLYGPLWIYIMNIVTIVIWGNIASALDYSLENHAEGSEHEAQLESFGKWAGLLTFYVFAIPAVIHFIFFFFGSGTPGYQRVLGVYGYSYAIFIPAYVLMIVPLGILDFVILGVAWFTSLFHISKELIEAGKKYLDDKVLKVIAIMWAVLHIGFCLLLKFVYFG